ncbi:MAG: hypothetical protein CMO80_18070 [Verrucomicrobiales bacterium]|nr:hypothetical protein [Verrucomicrobiales bacterium]|tara:strand:- start:2858 stop:3745 length:888 start_codon:yes stop_codon:yes gene_type:complete
MQRRQFLSSLAATAFAGGGLNAETKRAKRNELALFEKPLQSLSYDELAETVAEMGFDGIEATVRNKGHILPDQAEDELPKMVDALKKHGLRIQVMATSVSSPDDPTSAKLLRVAAKLGITRYRLAGTGYKSDRPILEQLNDLKALWKELAAFNRELGITGVYQNHAGSKNVGGPIWDLKYLLHGIEPSELGIAYDIRHAMVEGSSAWPISFRLIQPHIQAVYVKDFVFRDGRAVNVPMGDGHVGKRFYETLRKVGYHGPISLHVPHVKANSPESARRAIPAIAKDLAILKKLVGA